MSEYFCLLKCISADVKDQKNMKHTKRKYKKRTKYARIKAKENKVLFSCQIC